MDCPTHFQKFGNVLLSNFREQFPVATRTPRTRISRRFTRCFPKACTTAIWSSRADRSTQSWPIQALVVRTTPISQWKGLSSSQVAFGCVNAVFLASRGVTGPKYVIEGSSGLAQALDQSVHVEWEQAKLDCFDRLSLKSYNSAVPTQSAIFCALELHKMHPFDAAEIASIEADVVQDTYDFTGGGRFGPKTNVHTKEDADHSLPYLLAVALIDGDVQPGVLFQHGGDHRGPCVVDAADGAAR